MELNHLKYFYTVAKEGSFTRASQSLKIQQPTVSKMVRHLEGQLGVVLLERHKKGVRVTKSGGELFRSCEEIFDRIEEIRSFSARQSIECEGRLSFAVPSSVSSYLIPKILKKFLAQNPKSQASIWTGTPHWIGQEIIDGNAEFGILYADSEPSDFQVSDLCRVRFRLVIASQHFKDQTLRSSFVISRETDYSKSTPFPVIEMLSKNRLKFTRVISCNNLDSQKQLVREGMGVALLPAFMVKEEIEKGDFTVLQPQKDFSSSLKLVTRKGKVLSRDAATFLDTFRELVPNLI